MANTQPSSSPGGDEVRDANGDEHYQETELFEDTLVIHSPFIETEVQNLDLNTEVQNVDLNAEVQNIDLNAEYVEDSEPVESMTLITAATCEYEPEVVLDSEDEEMNNTGKVTVAERFLEDGSSPVVNNSLVLFKKKLPKLPCEHANSKSNATTSGKSGTGIERASIDAESFDDNNHQHLPARLYDVCSPEPGDSTVAALGFVDQYLSSIDVDLFQGVQNGKIAREKSPHVSSARGSISLDKKFKARNQNEDKDPFKWDDSVQNEKEAGIFCKKLEASFNIGSHGLAYKRRQKKGSHPPNQGKCSVSNRCDENLVQELRMGADNNNHLKELDVESCATRENVDIYSGVARTEDMYDIGLDTQIAAEAMDALANLSPAGFHLSDAHQQENTFDASLSDFQISDLKQAHQKNSPSKDNPGSHSIALKSYKRNVSSRRFRKVTSSSSCKDTNYQESNPVSGKMKKTMGSKSTVEGQFKNNASPSICNEHVSHEEVCLPGEDRSFQSASKEPKIQNKSKWTRVKRQPSHPRERNNNVEEDIIRYKRKGSCLVADPVRIDVKTKRLNSSISSYGVARKSSLNHQVEVSPQLSATSCFSKIDSWAYPKGPRGKRKRATAPRFLCIDDKENNVYSTKILEGRDDVHKSCLPPVSAGDATKFENLHDMQPLLLARVEILSNKSVVQSSSEISASVVPIEGIKIANANHTSNEHRKKACDKNLPKSSLLKELIRLGVPRSTSEMMSKDPRHRRDMTNVRVLFSQHLDDSVLKQQQKILTRLNMSTASSSMEATHFIADKFTRTKNMLETMALGNLVLTHLWLESCGQANCFIDEKNYILRDMKKEKEIGFSMPVSLARARQKPLLKGKRVYITPHIKPNKEVVASLVTAVHGQLVDENQIFADKNDNVLDDLLILSCEEDFAICRHFLKRGAAVYSSELVLNGIVIQKLELERHKLFVDQVTKNKLGRCNWFGKVYRRRLMPLS